MEVIITGLIIIFAIYIIVKSIKNSSKGKCNSGCKNCSFKGKCSSDETQN